MDSTPDVSHTVQLSVLLRIVNCESSVGAFITEHFCGLIDVLDTSGKGLYDTLLEKLEKHNLKISDCCGSYDNGSNMMGSEQGVQARILQLNNKAWCVPCGSHSLNLVLVDAAKSSVVSVSFFGVLLRSFSSSVQRWAVLQQHVKYLTVKSLSTTRWEAQIDSVKVVRYQLPEIVEALSALQTFAVEKKDSETMSIAKSRMK